MSESKFAQEVRDSLCKNGLMLKKRCCRRALYFGSITYRRSAKQSDVFIKLFEKLSGEGYNLPDEDSVSEIACGCANCLKNYICGVFIACGTMTDPDSTTYQLEMRVSDPENASVLKTLLDECGFPPKVSERGGCTVLYYKDSENIEDFLNFIGAQKASFAVMNAKIRKELRNNANRLANCDAANIDKTINTAQLQIRAIEKIAASDQIKALPPELKMTANLRIENPEATLIELARLHEPPITKSGVNHRHKKLIEMSEKLPDFDKI